MVKGTSNVDYREIEPRIMGPLTSKMLKGILFSVPIAVLVYFIFEQMHADLTTQLTATATAFIPGIILSSSKMKMHGVPFTTYLRCRLRRPFDASLKHTYTVGAGYNAPLEFKAVKKSSQYKVYR